MLSVVWHRSLPGNRRYHISQRCQTPLQPEKADTRCNWKAKHLLPLAYPAGLADSLQIAWEAWTPDEPAVASAEDLVASERVCGVHRRPCHPAASGDTVSSYPPSWAPSRASGRCPLRRDTCASNGPPSSPVSGAWCYAWPVWGLERSPAQCAAGCARSIVRARTVGRPGGFVGGAESKRHLAGGAQ